jgi:hypothetical protein
MNKEAYLGMLPEITDFNRPYWEGCVAGEIRLQACDECGHSWYPEGPVCPECLSERFTWRASSGRAELWSWIRMHQNYLKAFSDELPYLIAFVRLAEGPYMTSTIVDAPAELHCGMALEAVFDQVGAGRSVPKFRVAS